MRGPFWLLQARVSHELSYLHLRIGRAVVQAKVEVKLGV